MSRGRRFTEVTYARIGRNVRRYRKLRGLTQQQLAECVGVSRPLIALIEMGRSGGNLPTFARIAEELDVSMDRLYWEQEEPTCAAP